MRTVAVVVVVVVLVVRTVAAEMAHTPSSSESSPAAATACAHGASTPVGHVSRRECATRVPQRVGCVPCLFRATAADRRALLVAAYEAGEPAHGTVQLPAAYRCVLRDVVVRAGGGFCAPVHGAPLSCSRVQDARTAARLEVFAQMLAVERRKRATLERLEQLRARHRAATRAVAAATRDVGRAIVTGGPVRRADPPAGDGYAGWLRWADEHALKLYLEHARMRRDEWAGEPDRFFSGRRDAP